MKNIIFKLVKKASKNEAFKAKVASVYEKRQNWKKEAIKLNLSLKNDASLSDKDRSERYMNMLSLYKALDATSKYSHVKYRRRCRITNNARGLKFGICRGYLRQYNGFGGIAGLVKF